MAEKTTLRCPECGSQEQHTGEWRKSPPWCFCNGPVAMEVVND